MPKEGPLSMAHQSFVSYAGPEEASLDAHSQAQVQPSERRRASASGIPRDSSRLVSWGSSTPPEDGRSLAETDDLISQLSLAPLAVQSSYTPFEGRQLHEDFQYHVHICQAGLCNWQSSTSSQSKHNADL